MCIGFLETDATKKHIFTNAFSVRNHHKKQIIINRFKKKNNKKKITFTIFFLCGKLCLFIVDLYGGIEYIFIIQVR